MAVKDVILVIGASGQIGSDLVTELRKIYGDQNVVASDIKDPSYEVKKSGPFILLDVMDELKLNEIVREFKVTQVYLLAAILSATAERNIELGWRLNMRSISHVLDLARFGKIKKLYWPSSIAVFGSNTPTLNTPQHTITESSTVYGISKLAGERWCQYYNQKFGVDVRSLRYPG
ncbi:MAG: NAD-dependent epimerase/dehydratase family protein, partial [Flavobacteriales bacterium]